MRTEYITSRHNPLIQHVRKLLSSRSYRDECGEFAADGVKLLEEAIHWQFEITTLIETEDAVAVDVPNTVRRVVVPPDVMLSVSPMKAPQGALFLCRKPLTNQLSNYQHALVLDGLQDPGNVGTILRTADAMEIPVILTDDCADPFNPKTVRATMGALFRSTICITPREQIIAYCKTKNIQLTVTALTDRAKPLSREALNGFVVIGSEGNGASDALLAAADREIIIPMNPKCESLNAASAAAIVLWEMRKE